MRQCPQKAKKPAEPKVKAKTRAKEPAEPKAKSAKAQAQKPPKLVAKPKATAAEAIRGAAAQTGSFISALTVRTLSKALHPGENPLRVDQGLSRQLLALTDRSALIVHPEDEKSFLVTNEYVIRYDYEDITSAEMEVSNSITQVIITFWRHDQNPFDSNLATARFAPVNDAAAEEIVRVLIPRIRK